MKPKFQWDGTLTGWPQWARVPWLRCLYWPFWHTFYRFKRAGIAWRGRVNLVTDDELYALTDVLDEHPEGWEHPCACRECQTCD